MGHLRRGLVFSLFLISIGSANLRQPAFGAKPNRPEVNRVYTIPLINQLGDPSQRTEGKGYIWLDSKGRWHLRVQFLLIGATFFSGMSDSEIGKVIESQTAPDIKVAPTRAHFSKRRVSSLSEIPALADRIGAIIKRLEEIYTTDFLDTQFDFIFPDEDALISKEAQKTKGDGDDMLNLVEHFWGRPLEAYPLIWIASTLGNVLTPYLWLPWVREEYAAHELGHLLANTVSNDGFLFRDYPADGMMNNGWTFAALERAGGAVKITKEDWNYILSRHWRSLGMSEDEARAYFKPNFADLKEPVSFDQPEEAELKVDRWRCAVALNNLRDGI